MKDSFEPINNPIGSFLGKINGNLANTILDSIEAFICIIDIMQLRILWTNKYSSKRMGYTADEFNRMTPDEITALVQPCYQLKMSESIKRWRDQKKKEDTVVLQVKSRDHGWIWLVANSSIYEVDELGNVQYLLVSATEIDIAQINGMVNTSAEEEPAHPSSDKVKLLSVRERKILRYIINCNTDKEISEKLSISIHTAKTHRKRIIHKLGVKNSRTLIKYATEISLVEQSKI
jgi:DNA-binding CsgD family transcriptional regulator